MARATKLKQINVEMKNKVGLLADITSALSGAKLNIKSICAYGMDNKAYFMIITNNNAKARKALSGIKARVGEDNVIAVELPNRVGQLKQAAARLAQAGIDIHYMFGTAGTGKTALCIIKTANDNKALKVLR